MATKKMTDPKTGVTRRPLTTSATVSYRRGVGLDEDRRTGRLGSGTRSFVRGRLTSEGSAGLRLWKSWIVASASGLIVELAMTGHHGKKSELTAVWLDDYAKGGREPPEEFSGSAKRLERWLRTYRLLPSELDRLTLYDIWCSNLGPLWEQP